MLFNSLIFLLFAALFFFCMPLINRFPLNLRLGFILLASLFFYGWWNWHFIFLLVFTGLIDFLGALAIKKWDSKKVLFLVLSLGTNLGVLFFYKYVLFFLTVWFDLTGLEYDGMEQDLAQKVFIPIGLSFYTFQSMSYTIDVFRGRMEPTKNPFLFFSFISFFPHLVAGPIVRAREILPQLSRVRKTTETVRYHAVKLIIIGFFKKTVLADNLGSFVNEAFGSSSVVAGSGYWWVAMLAFTFQIYFDFSGYSDIARGIAKCMGIHFRMNFNHPYGASSFRDFWNKWHISLSYWFRDYVYIGLGGNKKGALRGHLNMWFTMLISGLWHGANYTYLIWGGLHALFLSIERFFGLHNFAKKSFLRKVLAISIVFVCCLVAWVFFRAKNIEQAGAVINQLFHFGNRFTGETTDSYRNAILFLQIAIFAEVIWVFGFRFKNYVSNEVNVVGEIGYLAILINCCLFFRGPGEQFIYFQF
jgi:alginate O-acetyltransferase complex protein AlgI